MSNCGILWPNFLVSMLWVLFRVCSGWCFIINEIAMVGWKLFQPLPPTFTYFGYIFIYNQSSFQNWKARATLLLKNRFSVYFIATHIIISSRKYYRALGDISINSNCALMRGFWVYLTWEIIAFLCVKVQTVIYSVCIDSFWTNSLK